jgi:hypothetical protein
VEEIKTKLIGDGFPKEHSVNVGTELTIGNVLTVIIVIQKETNANVETDRIIGIALAEDTMLKV